MKPSSASLVDDVRIYYDSNTARFSKHESGIAEAVHRAVWGPGVGSPVESYEYINRLIAEVVAEAVAEAAETAGSEPEVIDLGCGIGGTLLYLAERLPVQGVGVTISSVQAEAATRSAHRRGLEERCRFVVANYLELPPLPAQRVGYAIESFVHGPDAGAFFRSAASVLAPGGRLIVCDDFLTERGARAEERPGEPPPGLTPRQARRARRHLSDYRRGWLLGSLITVERAEELASAAGLALAADRDLTPYLDLRRPSDRLITAAVTVGRWLPLRSPWWRSLLGGHGVQMALVEELIRYRFLVFEKT